MTKVCSSTNVFPEWKISGMPFYVHRTYTLKNPETGEAFRVDVGSADPYSFFAFKIDRKVEQHRWMLNPLLKLLSTKLLRLGRRPNYGATTVAA